MSHHFGHSCLRPFNHFEVEKVNSKDINELRGFYMFNDNWHDSNCLTMMLRDCFISIQSYSHYKIARFKLQYGNYFLLAIYSRTHFFVCKGSRVNELMETI